MSKARDPWQSGRRAWQRLSGWQTDPRGATPTHPDDGASALGALADIGLIRRLIDHTELVAVRTARRKGLSWADIATHLGVSRQSAWERWRDVDDERDAAEQVRDVADTEEPGPEIESIAAAAAEGARRASRLRRASTVAVPSVIGLTWENARHALLERGLVGVGPDPDGPPLAALSWPDSVVTDQSPESGARVPPGSPVTLWLDRGGGSGVREPRRPRPTPRAGRAMNDEPEDQAVG